MRWGCTGCDFTVEHYTVGVPQRPCPHCGPDEDYEPNEATRHSLLSGGEHVGTKRTRVPEDQDHG